MSSAALKNKHKFITTPIYYVNDVPHIGHAYCTVGADVLARHWRQQGYDVLFSTGTDEHGQKIQQTAQTQNISPQQLVDRVSPRFRQLWSQLNISPHVFIRTTAPDHTEIVQIFFQRLFDNNDIYLGFYEGLYCRPCETYWTETQSADRLCPECGRQVEVLKEESFFLRQTKYRDQLLAHIERHPHFILPVSRKNEVLNLIKNLPDLSITRTTCDWGVAVCDDILAKSAAQNRHYIYVWFDALINYLTAAGGFDGVHANPSFWPPTVHLVGKDIVKFHAVTWPIMLLAVGLPLPETIFGHGFLTINGEKISKSKGNSLAAEPLLAEFGVDAVRFFLMREIIFGQDGSLQEEQLRLRYNADLANDLGNLLSRSLAMTVKYRDGIVPSLAPANFPPLGPDFYQGEDGEDYWQSLKFSAILNSIWAYIRQLNKYIEDKAPWHLAKTGENEKLDAVLYNLLESLRLIAIAIRPFMPDSAHLIFEQLGFTADHDDLTWGGLRPGTKVNKGAALFPRRPD